MERILQFSGGKDSLALLHYLEEELHDILVMWCNPGAPHESTLELMEHIRETVPNFIEIKGNQPAFVERFGYPSDIVPVSQTLVGRMVESSVGQNFVSAYDCCHANIWAPMNAAVKLLGGKHVYRGQKSCDKRKAPIRDGHVEDGITYHFPLQHWTDDDVFSFLHNAVPEHYKRGEKTSRDCWNCTAYLDENAARIAALPAKKRIFVQGKLATLLTSIEQNRARIEACMMMETLNDPC